MGLDLVELVIATGQHFGVTIDDQNLAKLRTPGQLASCVAARLAVKGEVRALVSDALGVTNFTDDSDFVRDLHAD